MVICRNEDLISHSVFSPGPKLPSHTESRFHTYIYIHMERSITSYDQITTSSENRIGYDLLTAKQQ